MRKGFTLVELSIVLVIIGLLIGGILVAQSMVDTAKLNKFIKQIQQFDIAINNFQTTYQSLPGDSPILAYPGNKDGLITSLDPAVFADNADNSFGGEIITVWEQLKQAGVKTGTTLCVNCATDSAPCAPTDQLSPAGRWFPKAEFGGKDTGIMILSDLNMNVWQERTTIYRMEHYLEPSWNNGGCASSGAPTYTPAQAAAVDTKIDDGNPVLGNVRAQDYGEYAVTPGSNACVNLAGHIIVALKHHYAP